eukprot:13531691-Heterocapsa_arctica.AAC.1
MSLALRLELVALGTGRAISVAAIAKFGPQPCLRDLGRTWAADWWSLRALAIWCQTRVDFLRSPASAVPHNLRRCTG